MFRAYNLYGKIFLFFLQVAMLVVGIISFTFGFSESGSGSVYFFESESPLSDYNSDNVIIDTTNDNITEIKEQTTATANRSLAVITPDEIPDRRHAVITPDGTLDRRH